ncbi:hypothetical protein BKA69DRAFT_1124356 [Paraphysoderma sedebokerense]|nr:hypothetical protein BKA69DRAFT_1124356 [Paraphysoderma sedebokerense]
MPSMDPKLYSATSTNSSQSEQTKKASKMGTLDPQKTKEIVLKRARIQKLSRAFKTRLDYCMFKNLQGWGNKNLKEVEELYEAMSKSKGISHHVSVLDFYPENLSGPTSPREHGWSSDRYSEPPTPPPISDAAASAYVDDADTEVTKAAETIMLMQNSPSPVVSQRKLKSQTEHDGDDTIPSTPLAYPPIQSPPTPVYHSNIVAPAGSKSYDSPVYDDMFKSNRYSSAAYPPFPPSSVSSMNGSPYSSSRQHSQHNSHLAISPSTSSSKSQPPHRKSIDTSTLEYQLIMGIQQNYASSESDADSWDANHQSVGPSRPSGNHSVGGLASHGGYHNVKYEGGSGGIGHGYSAGMTSRYSH